MRTKLGFAILSTTLTAFLVFSGYIQAVHAQEQKSSFAVSPPSFEFNANPGDQITNVIKVENLSDNPMKIATRAENFVAYGNGGQVSLTEDRTSYSIDTWITIDQKEAVIQPRESKVFKFIVNVPKNTEPGSHYGAVVFSTVASADSTTNGANIQQEIGALILIKVPGDVIEQINLDSFKSAEQFYQGTNFNFSFLLGNEGTVHIKPNGFIYIKDLFGNTLKTITIEGKNILPGSKRLFSEADSFENVGLYRAELELFYKDGQKVLRGETQFWALNLQRTAPILVGFIVLILFYLVFRKRINKAVKVILKG